MTPTTAVLLATTTVFLLSAALEAAYFRNPTAALIKTALATIPLTGLFLV